MKKMTQIPYQSGTRNPVGQTPYKTGVNKPMGQTAYQTGTNQNVQGCMQNTSGSQYREDLKDLNSNESWPDMDKD